MHDAVRIKAHCLGKSVAWLYAHPEIRADAPLQARIDALTARCRAGEPLAYLLERAEFHEITLKLTPHVLVPRPETEVLVETARREVVHGGKVLELGTGSGAVALALGKARPDLEITATDASEHALRCARDNAQRLGQAPRLMCSDWLHGINARFDAIVCNPPYVAEDDPCLTAPPLCFEPRMALDGGCDGLEAITKIITHALPRLRPGGMLALEHGFDQGARVRQMLGHQRYSGVATLKDLAGHERVSVGKRQ